MAISDGRAADDAVLNDFNSAGRVNKVNAAAGGLISFFADDLRNSPGGYIAVAIVLALFLLLLRAKPAPHLGCREPPLLKPRVPFVGHIIGLIRHHSNYFILL